MRLITYNIRVDTAEDQICKWENRREALIRQLNKVNADLIMVQEALPNQLNDLKEGIAGIAFIGQGRENNLQGEAAAIGYFPDRIELIDQGTFWLSETPETPSRGWDGAFNRICTWGLFKRMDNQTPFVVYNTHLDHRGPMAREQGIALIIRKLSNQNLDERRIILTGDLNSTPEEAPVQHLNQLLNDARRVTRSKPTGPVGTFNGFNAQKEANRRIDYIFVDNRVEVGQYAVLLPEKGENCPPSDHYPVMVDIEWGS